MKEIESEEKGIHSQFITNEKNNISSGSNEVLDNSIREKLNQFNENLKELTEKESAEKPRKIESIPDIKKNLNELSSQIRKQIEGDIFKKENEFLNSFGFIKEYIIKCICNKINSYADSIQFYVEHNLQNIESINSKEDNEKIIKQFKIMENNNYNKEIIELKKQNNNLLDQINSSFNEINNKNIEIMKLINENIKTNNEMYDKKQEEIKNALKKNEAMPNEMEIYKERLSESEKQLKYFEDNLGFYKDKANYLEENIEIIIALITSMIKKEKKKYSSYLNKIPDEQKNIFIEFNKIFKIIK